MARSKPPLLPEEALVRTVRTARMGGTLVLVIAGVMALLSASVRDGEGAVIGVLVALAGAMELHGSGMLRNGLPAGVRWLVSSQVYLLVLIVAWAGWNLANPDIEFTRKILLENGFPTQDQQDVLNQLHWTLDHFLLLTHRIKFGGVIVATLLYQGGMAVYYLRRRPAIEAALRELPES